MLPGTGENEHVERSDSGGYLLNIDESCYEVDGLGVYWKFRQRREITVVPPLP